MKIAVASEGTNVSQHFGHCMGFDIFEVEDKKIISEKMTPNPGHKPGFLPNFLNDMGVKVIITGGIGGGAIEIFEEKKIEVVAGAEGNCKTAVENYLNGSLKNSGSVCHDHAFESVCKDHVNK